MAAKKANVKKAAGRAKAAVKKVAAKVKAKASQAKARAKPKKAAPIPKGFHAVTPALVVRGANEAIAFYQKAFGAKLKSRMDGPGGTVMHSELLIGDSMVMVSDEFPDMGARGPQSIGGTPVTLMVYTKNVDAFVDKAVAAGAKVTMPVADQFWGDRYGKLEDPFGHNWAVATHIEDVSPKEMNKRAQAMFSGPPPGSSETTPSASA